MLTEPRDLDRAELETVLERHWRFHAAELEYLPVGFGSHHWRAVDDRGAHRFVTVDDLEAGFQAGPDTDAVFAALDRAFRTAAWLRDEAKLDFVVAPLFDHDGLVTRRLSDRYSITVSSFVAGETSTWGPYESPDDRRRMGGVLGRLHAVTERVPAGLPRREDFALPSRAALVEALHDLGRSWHSGPFAEPTRELLQARGADLERRLAGYDTLVTEVRESPEPWVITHGEPHRANVIRNPRGGVHLVDWDTALIAPRERDLRMVLDEDLTGLPEYTAVAGNVTLNQQAIHLYDLWWELCDVATFVADFRRPHERDEQTTASWENLASSLSSA